MRLPSAGAATVILLWTLAAADPVAAQLTPRLAHGDLAVNLGWLHANEKRLNDGAGWARQHFFRGIELGWYWTEQLKTTIDTGPETESYTYARNPVVLEGRTFENYSRYEASRRRFTITQQYQFGHNQWVHPFLAAGVEVVRERSQEFEPEIFAYEVNRPPRLVRGPIEHPERTDVFAQALVAGGVKAYVHRRVFFTSDLRIGFGQRLEEVLLRVGAGFDF